MLTEFDYIYCPNCAGTFQKHDNMMQCRKCDMQYFINPRPTNGVILKNKKGEVLLTLRKNNPKKGYWDLPGGFVDINETVEDSVTREIDEELHIKIKNIRYLTSFYDTYEFGGIKAYTICLLFEAEMIDEKNITPSDDVDSVKFFKPEEVPYDDFAFESMKAPVRNILEKSTS